MAYTNNRYYGGYIPQQPPMYQSAVNIQEMPIQAVRFMNEAEAKAYVLLPNQKEMLIDREKGVAYLKYTDSVGQSTCRTFKFEEENRDLGVSNFLTKDEIKNFATKQDFEALKKKIEEIQGGRITKDTPSKM